VIAAVSARVLEICRSPVGTAGTDFRINRNWSAGADYTCKFNVYGVAGFSGASRAGRPVLC
jgi:hypothetical protein